MAKIAVLGGGRLLDAGALSRQSVLRGRFRALRLVAALEALMGHRSSRCWCSSQAEPAFAQAGHLPQPFLASVSRLRLG